MKAFFQEWKKDYKREGFYRTVICGGRRGDAALGHFCSVIIIIVPIIGFLLYLHVSTQGQP